MPQAQDWPDRNNAPAALSGDTTLAGRARIAFSLRGDRADAMIVQLGGIDMLPGWTAALAEANMGAIPSQAGQGGRPCYWSG